MRLSSSTGRRIVAGVGAGATVLAVVSIGQPAFASTARHVVAGSRPTWTAKAKDNGHSAKSTAIDFGVLLKLRNQSQAEATLQRISDPKSADYGKWLTSKQFDATYAPSSSDVSAVRSWLRSQGFSVEKTLQSGMYVEVSGTAAQVEKTFGTSMNTYTYKGHSVQANTTDLSLPDNAPGAVVNSVQGFVGIDQGATLKAPAAKVLPGPPPGGRFGVQPCSAYFGQKMATDKPTAYGAVAPYATCGYYPLQYQAAYGEAGLVKSGIDGSGVTVAITDAYAAPTMLADAQEYSKLHGLQQFSAGQYREILPKHFQFGDPSGPQGWYGEEALDVDAVHGMAPGANVVFVAGSNDNQGLNNAWAETIDNHVADIITNSWTFGAAGSDSVKTIGAAQIAFFEQFSLEAALTGITVNFSSGDDGDNTAGGANPSGRTVEFPADLPYVTGVGGTSVEIGKSGNWMGEYGWSNSYSSLNAAGTKWTPAPPGDYSSGGGGGTSNLYKQPFYQKGNVPGSLSKMNGGAPMRVVPDISMPGDPNTGLRVGETQVFPSGKTMYAEYRIGGTSLSSPLLAGVLAVADQKAGHSLGFVNPLYYSLLGTSALHDLVAPTTPVTQVRTQYANGVNAHAGIQFLLQTIDSNSSTLADTPGYDNETGVGSPNGPAFFTSLAGH